MNLPIFWSRSNQERWESIANMFMGERGTKKSWIRNPISGLLIFDRVSRKPKKNESRCAPGGEPLSLVSTETPQISR